VRHEAELSLRLHADAEAERATRAHAFAFPPLAFPGVPEADGPLADGSRIVTIDDPALVVSAIEPWEEGDTALRFVNLGARSIGARIAIGVPCADAEWVDLAGRGLRSAGKGTAIEAVVAPWRLATLRLRRGA
jgi:hypothetical protein